MNKKRFERVAVLKGGVSIEREVSLRSGAAVAQGLRQAGYQVMEIDVTSRALDLPAEIEAVFIVLHGEFGEDGQVQALLEQLRIPYTGADAGASMLAFDKGLTKHLLARHGIATADYELLRKGQARTLPLPVVVKPVRQGSSFGVHKVTKESEWAPALADALQYAGEALVEAYIAGKELTVGIVDGEVLPVIEIRAPDNNYDYRAKYTKGVTEYLVPAPITEAETRRAQELARQTFHALNCRALGRIDLRLQPDGRMYVLELNSIPGFTETSLLPKAAAAAGYDFASLCDRILQLAAI